MSMTGDEDGGYIRSPISPIDQMTGVHAFSGILALLYAREKTGQGGEIQVSLFETALGLLGYNLQTFWERGVQPPKCGSSHESLCPYQAFEAADGPIMIGVANDNLWRKFCAVAGLSAVVDDPRFRTNADRVAHRKETIGQVQSALAQHPVGYWNDALAGAGVPCAPINSIAQLLDHPHTRASGIIVEYEHQTAGRLKGVGHPVLIDGAEREAGLPPPVLGQHTDDVLGEMGLSVETIRDLRRARVIA
jgi:crotonobetainyl-CoA:carnitine CoA-transferase CaiB-like acyl-CoA transferase